MENKATKRHYGPVPNYKYTIQKNKSRSSLTIRYPAQQEFIKDFIWKLELN